MYSSAKIGMIDFANIKKQLDAVYDMGIRQMELVNKFDNALAGVAGDGGEVGVVTNQGNKKETNRYWDMKTCQVGQGDKEQIGVPRDLLIGNGLNAFLPPGALPVYGDPPHCNQYGLSDLGEYVVREMMKRGMVIDPDHLSQAARDEVLAIVEAERYPGIMSSHSWSNMQDYPRILAQGGVVTPMGNSVTGFVESWQKVRQGYDKRFYNGFGYGADMNGFANQAGPRNAEDNPVRYPFKSFDGKVTLDKQASGERVYDINSDGMAHYGLFPDWLEEARVVGGDGIVEEMARGAEAYLQMWERAIGIAPDACRDDVDDLTQADLAGLSRGMTPEEVLRTLGQPSSRQDSTFTYCLASGAATLTFDGEQLAGWNNGVP